MEFFCLCWVGWEVCVNYGKKRSTGKKVDQWGKLSKGKKNESWEKNIFPGWTVVSALGRSLRSKTDGIEVLSQGWSYMTSQYPFQCCNLVITSLFENPLVVFSLPISRCGDSALGQYAFSAIWCSWFKEVTHSHRSMHLASPEPWKVVKREFEIPWLFLLWKYFWIHRDTERFIEFSSVTFLLCYTPCLTGSNAWAVEVFNNFS